MAALLLYINRHTYVCMGLIRRLYGHMQVDPFFVPTTEEEREEWGEETSSAATAANVARRLIDAVRRRKGQPV